ncbi:MAG: hypothetical protein IPI38_07835 [Gemmatimonadetes bacterium]|nr:hypothetical protein [Gemmatimonadota bacterium]MBK6782181.1 hypothetical protein [Gemmatimonadota bacterium]MBK7351909.1 hypothetical protein [Gemmatimonadota bacterium]MBK7715318.1 hypothetical protein [Gemmatimonadota bacterium]MBK7785053.1 hypothetical protein [Gemmatimonadota bacterium]
MAEVLEVDRQQGFVILGVSRAEQRRAICGGRNRPQRAVPTDVSHQLLKGRGSLTTSLDKRQKLHLRRRAGRIEGKYRR